MATSPAQLIVQLQGSVIQTLPLTLPVLRIGRTPESGLMLDSHLVSRAHAELRVTPQGAVLTDLGSSNGTFIGTQRLLANQPQLLKDGGSFRIGPYILTYRTSASETQTQVEDEEMPRIVEQATLPPEVLETRQQLPLAPRPEPPARRAPERAMASLYARYLPDIYQENDFLQRFLHIFEDIWEPLEQRQDHIEMYLDPRTCPAVFLPWLASWLGVPIPAHWPEARKRRLLSQAMELYSWRGTLYGLARMIEICTGLRPEITEKPTEPFVFHVRIALAPSPTGEHVDRTLIEELIQIHKPAYAGYVLEVK